MSRVDPARWLGLAVALSLSACGQPDKHATWSLVGLYDGAALSRFGDDVASGGYSWQADEGVEEWCGRAKGPLGLGGAMDAEIMARGRAPYLVAMVAGPADQRLDTSDISLFVTKRGGLEAAAAPEAEAEGRRHPLAPAVVPRRLEVNVKQSATSHAHEVSKMARQLQAQLTVQLCLEHQAGRAWTGTAEDPSRRRSVKPMQNIFMLDELQDETRRIFVGQGASAAPLLGPPVWVPGWEPSSNEPAVVTGRNLRSADLFAFLSPLQASSARELAPVLSPPRSWPSRYAPLVGGGVACPGCDWQAEPPSGVTVLELTVTEFERTDVLSQRLGLQARWRTRTRTDPADAAWSEWLHGEVKPIPEELPSEDGTAEALPDVLGAIPYEYPRLVADFDRGVAQATGVASNRALTVLMIPNWQLVNAWRFVERPRQDPLESLDPEPFDAVGWILDNPELLNVQKLEEAREADGPRSAVSLGKARAEDLQGWRKLLPASPRFGANPDFRALSAPAAVLGGERVTARMQRLASRAGLNHLVVVALIILITVLLPGVGRLTDLWSAQPRERAWGWPSRKQEGLSEVLARASGDGGDT